jgi:hypothetical protein
MGTTTNNGWTYPESTDLVKDGATAIQTLADDIDTTLGVYAASTSGLTLINTTTFSGVSASSLPTSTFTSSYTNYKIIVSNLSASTGISVYMRLRASGTDNTSSIYYQQQQYNSSTTISGVRQTQSFWSVGAADTTSSTFSTIELFNPQTTAKTRSLVIWQQSGITTPETLFQTMTHDSATAFDSVTIYSSSGTMTGTIYVYGFSQ